MNNLDKVINDIKNGVPVVVVDDRGREDEADIVISASSVNVQSLLFAMRHARGLMCLPCMQSTLDRLAIPMMPSNHLDRMATPFTVSVDAVSGTTTGMSVFDRMKTISVLVDPNSKPTELSQPGHLFPLRANENLLKGRRGHTEVSIELMRLADQPLVSIIMEIMNEDGTMLNGEQAQDYADKFNLNITSLNQVYDKVYCSGL